MEINQTDSEKILDKVTNFKNEFDEFLKNYENISSTILIDLINLRNKLYRYIIKNNKNQIEILLENSIQESYNYNNENNQRGRIRIGRIATIDEKGRKFPITLGYMNIVVEHRNKTKLGGNLHPSRVKYNDIIFSNIWNFSKIYEKLPAQNRRSVTGKNGWKYNAQIFTQHNLDKLYLKTLNENMDINDFILKEYWCWREKGINFSESVYNPDTKYHLWPIQSETNSNETNLEIIKNMDNEHYPAKLLTELDARKRIYQKIYTALIQNNDEFITLKKMINDGYNIQLLANDITDIYTEKGVYGEDGVGSFEVNMNMLSQLILDPDITISHVYILSMALLDDDFNES